MARITEDREDLLREATALVPRILIKVEIQGCPCEVFAGFRGESLSIYFGSSPVYHFNAKSELRRAFADDCLFKADQGQLVRSVRERSTDHVVLASRLLSEEEFGRFAYEAELRLNQLRDQLIREHCQLVGEVPEGANVVSRLTRWLEDWPGPRIAHVANVS